MENKKVEEEYEKGMEYYEEVEKHKCHCQCECDCCKDDDEEENT